MRVLFVYRNLERFPCPVAPVGMLCVAASTSAAGHEVRALDLSFASNPAGPLRQAISSFAPDAVGISIRVLGRTCAADPRRSVHHIDTARELVALARACGAAPVVAGGPGFSHAPGEAFAFLEPDFGIEGEGERSFPALLEAVAGRADFGSVAGLWRRTREGETVRNPPVPIADIDSLPPQDIGLIDYSSYLRRGGHVSVGASRGCDRSCLFCDDPVKGGGRVRMRTPERVAEEIALVVARHGHRHFYFADSLFTCAPPHTAGLCDALLARGLRVHWEAEPNPRDLSEDLAGLMKRAGCGGVVLGVDSGSETMLAAYRKGFTRDDIARAARACARHGLPFMFTVLVGGPGETPETFRETVRFLEGIDPPDAVSFGFGVDVYRGTGMLERARAEGALPERADFLRGVGYVSLALGDGFASEIERVCARHAGWFGEARALSTAGAAWRTLLGRLGHRPIWKGLARAERTVLRIPGLRGLAKG